MEKTVQELLFESYAYSSRHSMELSPEDQAVQKALFGAARLTMKSGDEAAIFSDEETKNLPVYREILEMSEQLIKESSDLVNAENPEKSIQQMLVESAEDVVIGSAKESNLDSYGYDMVVGLTLGSVNATMKEYIMNMGVKPETRYYVERYDEKTGVITVDEANTKEKAMLDALHLFDIPADPAKRTEAQKQAIQKADDYHLSCAFTAGFGIPDWAKPSDIESIIDFDTGEAGNQTKVKYKLFFKEFTIIQTTYNSFTKKADFIRIDQSDKLWIFSFNVNLGLIGVDLKDLPEKIRAKVNNIDPGSMFSIQQLFLDLNTTALQDFPTISGITDTALDVVNRKFLNVYFNRLRELGDVIFAYSVKPAGKHKNPYILTPTDFRFYVSPYLVNGKPDPTKKKLYTLNYLVMCEYRLVPSVFKPFTWNWVDEKDYSAIHGTMTINKNRIYDFAKKEYVNIVSKLLMKPYIDMKCTGVSVILKANLTQDTGSVSFDSNNYFRFSKTDDTASYWVLPPMWGNAELKFTNESRIKTYQNSINEAIIECSCNLVTYLKMNIEGGVSNGNIYNKTSYYTLKVSVDTYGNLSFIPSVTETDHGADFDYNGWSKFISAGAVTDMVNSIKSFVTKRVDHTKDFASGSFLNSYNKNAMWVLPGDQTFTFKNPKFSNGSDLSFDINYVKPK